MKTIYLISKFITLPGAFLKGFWEHLACRLLHIPVENANYLPADVHCGHVQNSPAQSPAQSFLLALLPYLAQRALAWIFIAAAAPPLLLFGVRSAQESHFFFLYLVALYFGLSLLCNSFPSWPQAQQQWRLFYGETAQASSTAKILLAPCNAWFFLGAWLEKTGIFTLVLFAAVIASWILW
ncbi:MAG: hypothetical protein FWD06_10430 [Oscillospiraceae bacterium]|nr:hypothetical protein [Oscillospiraceae bacterium]